MSENLHIKEEYTISFKRKIFLLFTLKNSFQVFSDISEFHSLKEHESLKKINHFSMFNIDVDKVNRSRVITLDNRKYIDSCNLFINDVLHDKNTFKILQISDLRIKKRYRGFGIGTQLINIITTIAKENNIKYITGELQADREKEPLMGRKKFFTKNGYDIIKNSNSKLSGYIIKKVLKK